MEKQFTYLMMLEEDGNHYRYFKMIPGSATFHTETGRVSVAPVVKERILALKHMVASHHGTLEWEAIKIPGLAEAMFLHFLDNLDAKMYVFEKSDENTEAGTMDDGRRPMGARAWHASFHAVKES